MNAIEKRNIKSIIKSIIIEEGLFNKKETFNLTKDFSDQELSKILKQLVKRAKKKYGKIIPTAKQSKFSITIHEELGINDEDLVSFYFNSTDGSTHVESWNEE
jgi:hypothetical protein